MPEGNVGDVVVGGAVGGGGGGVVVVVVVVVVLVVVVLVVVVEGFLKLPTCVVVVHAEVTSAMLATTPEQMTFLELICEKGPGAPSSVLSTWWAERLGDPSTTQTRYLLRQAAKLNPSCVLGLTSGGGHS
jgi:hypothetical protein